MRRKNKTQFTSQAADMMKNLLAQTARNAEEAKHPPYLRPFVRSGHYPRSRVTAEEYPDLERVAATLSDADLEEAMLDIGRGCDWELPPDARIWGGRHVQFMLLDEAARRGMLEVDPPVSVLRNRYGKFTFRLQLRKRESRPAKSCRSLKASASLKTPGALKTHGSLKTRGATRPRPGRDLRHAPKAGVRAGRRLRRPRRKSIWPCQKIVWPRINNLSHRLASSWGCGFAVERRLALFLASCVLPARHRAILFPEGIAMLDRPLSPGLAGLFDTWHGHHQAARWRPGRPSRKARFGVLPKEKAWYIHPVYVVERILANLRYLECLWAKAHSEEATDRDREELAVLFHTERDLVAEKFSALRARDRQAAELEKAENSARYQEWIKEEEEFWDACIAAEEARRADADRQAAADRGGPQS